MFRLHSRKPSSSKASIIKLLLFVRKYRNKKDRLALMVVGNEFTVIIENK